MRQVFCQILHHTCQGLCVRSFPSFTFATIGDAASSVDAYLSDIDSVLLGATLIHADRLSLEVCVGIQNFDRGASLPRKLVDWRELDRWSRIPNPPQLRSLFRLRDGLDEPQNLRGCFSSLCTFSLTTWVTSSTGLYEDLRSFGVVVDLGTPSPRPTCQTPSAKVIHLELPILLVVANPSVTSHPIAYGWEDAGLSGLQSRLVAALSRPRQRVRCRSSLSYTAFVMVSHCYNTFPLFPLVSPSL